jgi:GntR family transcriptional regulator
MRFAIHPHSTTPIYRQIVEQIERQVAGGLLVAGAELPSVRAVAQEHAINPMTVSKAYSLLEARGLLVRLRGVGMVVAQAAQHVEQVDPVALLRPALTSAAQVARELGVPDADALALLQRCLDEQGALPKTSVASGVVLPTEAKGNHD